MLKRWKEIDLLRSRIQGIHHRTFAVDPIQWDLNDEVLEFLLAEIRPTMKTLEVGVGLSTLIFVKNRTSHLSLAQSPEERERILEVCMWEHLNSSRLEMSLDDLGQTLAATSSQPTLDLLLLNAEDGFPRTPNDWQRLAGRIKTGGYLVLGNLKFDSAVSWFFFLRNHPHWQLERNFSWRAAAFRKIKPSSDLSPLDELPSRDLLRNRFDLLLRQTFWGPISGNTYWQKWLGRWIFENLYLNCWKVFYEDVVLTLYIFVIRKLFFFLINAVNNLYYKILRSFYYEVLRKPYLFISNLVGNLTSKLIFHLIPSWAIKVYTYARTLVWMINLPEWPGILRMWFWRAIPRAVRRENLKHILKRTSEG